MRNRSIARSASVAVLLFYNTASAITQEPAQVYDCEIDQPMDFGIKTQEGTFERSEDTSHFPRTIFTVSAARAVAYVPKVNPSRPGASFSREMNPDELEEFRVAVYTDDKVVLFKTSVGEGITDHLIVIYPQDRRGYWYMTTKMGLGQTVIVGKSMYMSCRAVKN